MTRLLARLLIAVLCLGTTTVLLEGPAFAHGQLVESTPEKGGTLAEARQTLTMWFTEAPPRNAHFTVTAPGGERVERQWLVGATKRLDEPVTELFLIDGKWEPRLYHEGYSVELPVAYWPKVGEYTVEYLSIASDGEEVKGKLEFTYAGKPTKAPGDWTEPTAGPDPGLLAAIEAAHSQKDQQPVTLPTTDTQTVTTAAPTVAPSPVAAPDTGDDSPLVWLIPVVLGAGVIVLLARAMRRPPAKKTSRSGNPAKNNRPKAGAKKR
ncbi:copper resistance CopC family protein [Herbidospora daliensis]|uniref:copper resistance CopC family protein n=1 Tax=Herbidospora daliensis TaxID=295585 RepID=UPI0007862F28|nr:copper resistance protein CopC [Herbidospora daliensis]